MNSHFKILFRLRFKHRYFADAAPACFSILPDKETQNVLTNHDLLFKKTNDGFTVLYEAESGTNKRERSDVLKAAETLCFVVKLEDPLFFSYTAVADLSLTQTVFLFNNEQAVPEAGAQADRLHTEEFVSAAQVVALSSLEKDYFVKPFALIHIHLNKVDQEELLISFRERSTFWRYLIVSDHLKDLNEPAVINGDQVFDGPTKFMLPGNREALAFVSVRPIPLQQKSAKKFQLLENFDRNTQKGKVVLRALPFPDVNLISALSDKQDEKEYSEIII